MCAEPVSAWLRPCLPTISSFASLVRVNSPPSNVTPQSKRAARKHTRTAETAVSQKGSRSTGSPFVDGARRPPASSPLRAYRASAHVWVTEVRRNRHDPSTVQAAVAAGHPATLEAGIEVLADGGSAADAAVAASLASCVAETVMTGLLSGGFGAYFEAATGRVRNLDCFVAMPGIGGDARDAELVHLQVPFGEELVHYAIGPASCAVPGLPAGLEALWRDHGRLPWTRLVEPSLRLARAGVEFPSAHAACLAMLAPVMTMNEGARIYSPGGRLLQTGGHLEQPGLVHALELIMDEGPASAYRGSLAESLLGLVEERGGLVTSADLQAYGATWSEPVEVGYLGLRVLTRGGLSQMAETLP